MNPTETIAEGEVWEMTRPCVVCGCTDGRLSPRNGQACCFCQECGKHVYNVPKHELGLKPQPMRDDGTSPSARMRVMERAAFRCEFCGADAAAGHRMDIGHLLSQKDVRDAGLPLRCVNDFDNLALLCDQCNSGMGSRSLTLHDYLIFQLKRKYREE